MKKSILTIAFAASLFFAGSIQAQTKPSEEKTPPVEQLKPETPEVFRAEITAEQKEVILQILNAAKTTLLKSSNSNTTEQNVQLINSIQEVMTLMNERFVKAAENEKIKPK